MAQIDRIVNVAIALRTTAITEASFSDMLILAPHTLSVGRVMVITAASELLDLGITATDKLYLAASDSFKGIPSVRQVFIGRQQVNSVSASITKAVETATYSVTVGWRDTAGDMQSFTASHIGGASDTTTTIATALAALIAAEDTPVAATTTGGVLNIVAEVYGTAFSLSVKGNIEVQPVTSSETPTEALSAITNEGANFYGVTMTSRAEADILDAADWVETNAKLGMFGSKSAGILSNDVSNDIASKMQERQLFRSTVFYTSKADDEYPECAIMSHCFTFYPGAETWALKKLPGLSYTKITEGQYITANRKNAMTFEPFRNFAITQGGKVAAGEWIDVIRFRDWLEEQIKVNVVSTMINADGKIPYTDPGIEIVVAAMREALDLGVRRGGIAPPELDEFNKIVPSYTTEAPKSQVVAFNDKANRVLRDVKFTARLAGAIHTVEIKGSLTY